MEGLARAAIVAAAAAGLSAQGPGLFGLHEMDYHLRAGMECPYDTWRPGKTFETHDPPGAPGHKALFAKSIWRTTAKTDRDVRTIPAAAEYRFFHKGEPEDLIRLRKGSSIYVESGRDTGQYFEDPACPEALITGTLPLARAGAELTVSTDNHRLRAAGKPFHPEDCCAPMGATARHTMRELLALRAGQALPAVPPPAAQNGFQPLFNGKNLEGWIADTPGIWSVRDRMIVGKTQGLKHNDFLRTRKHYKDFTLKLRFRLLNGTGNSGIQFRSVPVEGSHEVSGYQADIGETYWGCLYDESRRRKVLAQASPASLATLRKDAWNEYVITARGNHITLDLNGVRTVDYQEREPGMDVPGLIAIQVHGGPPLEVQFRDIRIQEH